MSHVTTEHDPVYPDVQMNVVKPKAPVTGRVVATHRCMKGKSASFIRHVAIDVGGTPLEGVVQVGQSFGVTAPGVAANGKPHAVRLYSCSSPSWGEDGQGRVIATTPKRVIDERTPQKDGDDPDDHRLFLGVCSNYLCDLRVGDEVQVSGPNGKRFLLPVDTEAHDYLFLATGTGVAPFRGMAMELFDRPAGPTGSDVRLVMGTPYTTDLLYDDLFTNYAKTRDNFTYDVAISREARPDGGRGWYVHQLIEQRLDAFRPMLENPRTIIYICGLIGMQFGLYQVLATAGLGDGYFVVGEALQDVDPAAWTRDQMRRHIRPTARLCIEVY